MATSVEIMCINKTPRMDPHERIQNVGGVHNGQAWKMSQPEAIQAIQAGKYDFHVTKGGRTVRVIVATSAYGNKYLKTENDGVQPDNLLSLKECP